MALVKCEECGNEVSTQATACPKCGAKPPKQTSGRALALFGIVAVLLVKCIWDSNAESNRNSTQEAAKTPEERAAEARAEAKVQETDRKRGAAVQAALALRDAAHDPQSFQLEEALFMVDNAGCYVFRARNGFGGMRRLQGVYTPYGALLTSESGSGFAKAWNKHCANQYGEPITAITQKRLAR